MHADGVSSEVKGRMQRFLGGEQRPDDLAQVFLALRAKASAPLVREIGDFIAHRDERSKGYLWTRARHLSAMWAAGLDRSGSTAIAKAGLLACLRLTDATEAVARSGMSVPQIESAISSAVRKLEVAANGRLGPARKLHQAEEIVLRLFDPLRFRSYFTQETLLSQLISELIRQGVLSDGQEVNLLKQGAYITVFSFHQMHRTIIRLPTGQPGMLYLANSMRDDGEYLAVHCRLTIPGFSIPVVNEVALSECRVEDWVPTITAFPLQPYGAPAGFVGLRESERYDFYQDDGGRLSPLDEAAQERN